MAQLLVTPQTSAFTNTHFYDKEGVYWRSAVLHLHLLAPTLSVLVLTLSGQPPPLWNRNIYDTAGFLTRHMQRAQISHLVSACPPAPDLSPLCIHESRQSPFNRSVWSHWLRQTFATSKDSTGRILGWSQTNGDP